MRWHSFVILANESDGENICAMVNIDRQIEDETSTVGIVPVYPRATGEHFFLPHRQTRLGFSCLNVFAVL